ncbi:MAG: lipid-A-disaccharide synthase [Alistipes sp.]
MKYYLIAGEPSGDLHGANLMKGLKAHDPKAEFRFWGGDKMAAIGGVENLEKHYKETSFFGLVQVFLHLRTIGKQFKECQADVAAFAPDVLILVDYPGFNMKMAKWAKQHGIQTFYYIAPKVWAWREYRIKAIRKYVDKLFIIFPFERDYFPKHGITPIFEGNPLVDAIQARRDALPDAAEFRRINDLDERPIVALLAGSRRSEIQDNLPLMAALATRFRDRQFVVTAVPWIERALYEQLAGNSGIRYVCDQTYETLHVAEAAVVTSGTATLETALFNVPEVVVYRTLWLQVKLYPHVLKVPYISLVNLNLGRESVREIVQSTTDVTAAEQELKLLLTGGAKRQQMLADFAELHTIIGGAGASDRFAAKMVSLLQNTEGKGGHNLKSLL